ncbi:metallo-beta-lactamase family protein [Coniochaeta ligniaria NRRL 30616]|uniref:Metallo-beta-lactamase family protein n=1 Tax=Coniochaeta ligniaria NRRL 30616 TaxID=1408157 RepID=A0A1J7IFF1_9PEZI|nr:metallo-beta-lactamase family protein [Coniochaeta ligniaria NRRL 30616]
MTTYDPVESPTAANLICNTCGTQYPVTDHAQRSTCLICDDPRQYVPPTGQSFTTLRDLTLSPQAYHNDFTPYSEDDRLISIHTVPKFAIGQRAILVRTPSGKNILWDCVTYLDVATVARINNLGGLAAIVISHPHYYSTHSEWSRAFNCPVYTAARDAEWKAITTETDNLLDAQEDEFEIEGVKVLQLGGHFPGSLVMLFDGRLLIADTLLTTPAGVGRWTVDAAGEKRDKPKGLNTFSFMWSIPNWIPLSPDEIVRMWIVLKKHDLRSTHGAFVGQDIEDVCIKQRILESMQIQVQHMGWVDHPFLKEFTVIVPRLNI